MTRAYTPDLSARRGRETRALEEEVGDLRRLSLRGVVESLTGTTVMTGTIGATGNQALVSGQTGIRRQTANITAVSTAYDPATGPTTTADPGIGWADLRLNGVTTGQRVLIVHDPRSALSFDLLGGDVVVLAGPVSIAVTGGGGATVSCYYAVWI